jgi:release factor glutamine methyltransferase
MKRLDLYMQFDRPLVEVELEALRPLVKRAVQKEPLEYILGRVAFYNTDIALTRAVLIPRPETEILVDLACKQLKASSLEGKGAWDLCTGSGCMGIALKKNCPELSVTLSDLSKEALDVARNNALQNGVEVECLESDLLTAFQGKKADVVFCNPPYVTEREYGSLDPSVREFEPKMALVGGEEGLDFYKRLKKELPSLLNSGAKIFLEMGSTQGAALQALFSEAHWRHQRIEKDWAGHERFFFLEFE